MVNNWKGNVSLKEKKCNQSNFWLPYKKQNHYTNAHFLSAKKEENTVNLFCYEVPFWNI
jgi:hypothetical protein